MLSIPLAWRLARRLQQSWTKVDSHEVRARWQWLDRAWSQLARQRERWAKARDRHLAASESRLRDNLDRAVAEFGRAFGEAQSSLASHSPRPTRVSDFFADIRELEAEFENVAVRWKEKILRVTTEAIALQEVELGPFAIDLKWERWNDSASGGVA